MLIISSTARGYAELPKIPRHLSLDRWKLFQCRGTAEPKRINCKTYCHKFHTVYTTA